MKHSALVFSLFFLFLIAFFIRCSQHIPQKTGELVFTEQDSLINVKSTDRFVIELQSRIGGGYSWVFLDSSYQEIVKLGNIEYVRPSPISEDESARPINRYHFQPIRKGTTRLNMAFSRPWEKEIPEHQKRVFFITIQ